MLRLTAYISGNVQKVGYRAKVAHLAKEMGLIGSVQNLSDGRVLVVAEGLKEDLERFASSLKIKNVLVDVEDIKIEYTAASGAFAGFRKIADGDDFVDRLDTGIEILKDLVAGVNSVEVAVKSGFENLGRKMDTMLDKQDKMLDKQDKMLDKQDKMLEKQDKMLEKQDETIGEIQGLRYDLKSYINYRFERIEAEMAELRSALRERGII